MLEGHLVRCRPLTCPPPLAVDPSPPFCPLPIARPGKPYNANIFFTATGGYSPYSWSQTGLPEGMDIETATGGVFGTAAVEGMYPFVVTVTDSIGKSAGRICSILVREVPDSRYFADRMKENPSRFIRDLAVADGPLQAGRHEFTRDGSNERGEAVGSGVYFARTTVDGKSAHRKMTLVS